LRFAGGTEFWHFGAIAPGYQADVLLLPELESFVPELVLKRGKPIGEIPHVQVPDWVRRTMHLSRAAPDAFRVPWRGGKARVIGLIPDQIATATSRQVVYEAERVILA
jgi:adenine deaminase